MKRPSTRTDMTKNRSLRRGRSNPVQIAAALSAAAIGLGASAGALGQSAAAAPGATQSVSPAQAMLAAEPGKKYPEFPQLSLNADAAREVTQDRVAVVLAHTLESADPAGAQRQVNERLNPVLAKLRDNRNIEVQSEGYSTQPTWSDGRIVSWRVRGGIRVTGTPSEAFNQLIGEVATALNVESVSYFLSEKARRALEEELIAEAFTAFRHKAEAAAKSLGYASWSVRAVSLSDASGDMPQPMPKMMMARAAGASDAAPMPIAEGRTTVRVGVSGSVVLLRP